MAKLIDVTLPDIGDFDQVEVIEILVAVGDKIAAEDSMVMLESDKASMEIPAPQAGIVKELNIQLGDKLSQGDLILRLESITAKAASSSKKSATELITPVPDAVADSGDVDKQAQVVVLGAGPGGYTAAFRAADLGQKVILIERHATLGGVCLNVGCIPSKALLHAAAILEETPHMAGMGIHYAKPEINLDEMRAGKDKVVNQLTAGLAQMAKMRGVEVVEGVAKFTSSHQMNVVTADGDISVGFDHAIIAAGSRVVKIPGFPFDDPRMMDSTDALELAEVPEKMLIIGGGIIGLEMATVYSALGSQIDVVELGDGLMPSCDRDLVRPLLKRIKAKYNRIMVSTGVTAIESLNEGLKVSFEGKNAPASDLIYDRVLVSVGRAPNGGLIDADKAGVQVDERGFISVDGQMRTNVPHIFAIGDLVGQPMLAHKAVHEAKVAAEVIHGEKVAFDPITIPSVAFTDPEIAWMGLTETQAKADGIAYEKSVFPWVASGRAIGIGRDEGLTKLIFDPETQRVLGAGIVGVHAGDLISEAMLAIEMGADMEDIGLTIHPHPTLGESIGMAAEVALGSATDLPPPRKRKAKK